MKKLRFMKRATAAWVIVLLAALFVGAGVFAATASTVNETASGTYTIHYDANGGTGTMSDQTVSISETVTLTENTFTRSAYTFSSWNTQEDGTGTTYTDSYSGSALSSTAGDTVTLYAQWTINTDTVIVSSRDNYYDAEEWAEKYEKEYGEYGSLDTNDDGTISATEAYPSGTYTGYWTKLSETEWMYTFYVYDKSATYYVWEDSVDGYTGDYTELNPYTLSDGTTVAVITNTDDSNPEYGSLSITKTVVDADGNTVADSSASFTVRVTITDADGCALSGTDLFGDYAFNNGVGTITIAAGATVTLDDIPVGYKYSVEEINTGSYTVTYQNQTGTITADSGEESEEGSGTESSEGSDDGSEGSSDTSSSAVVITNTLPESSGGGDGGGRTMNVTLAKAITGSYGDTSEDALYTFYMNFTGLALDTAYTLTFYENGEETTAENGNGSGFTSSNTGTANVTIYLKAGQSVKVSGIPEGATYLVTEAAGDYTAAYSITDANGLGLINTTSAENTSENKSLSTATETADMDNNGTVENVTITFTNTLEKTQDIVLKKVSYDDEEEDTDDNTQYEITVTFTGLSAGASVITSSGRLTADTDGEIEAALYIKSGETITFYDVPVGVQYQFTEESNSRIASYTVTDSASGSTDTAGTETDDTNDTETDDADNADNADDADDADTGSTDTGSTDTDTSDTDSTSSTGTIASASGSNTKAYTDLSTATETVDEGEEITVTFKNTYNSTQDVTLKKETYYFNGSKDRADNTEYEFTVTFTGLTANAAYTYGKKTFTAGSDGSATVTLTLQGWNSVTFEGLPLNATYQVTESANNHVAAYTVVDADDGDTIASASGSNTSANTDLATATETVNKGEEVTITFQNTGPGAYLKVRKVNSDGSSLGGATFDLYMVSNNESEEDTLIASNITTESDTTSENYGYSSVIEGLAAGTYYFVETDAPDGYYLSDGTLFGYSTKYFTITTADYGETVTITIADSVLSILASTGGIGLGVLILMSIAIVMAAVVAARRKRNGAA